MKKVFRCCMVFFLCFFFMGCTKELSNGNDSATNELTGINPQSIGTEKTVEFQKKSWKITHTSTGEYFDVATICSEKIIGCSYEGNGIRLSSIDKNTGNETESFFIPENGAVQSICADNEGDIYLCCLNDEQHSIWKIKNNEDIKNIELEINDLGILSSVNSFFVDKNNFFYLWYKMSVPCNEVYGEGYEDFMYTKLDRIYVLDKELNCVCYEQVPDSNFNKLIALLFDENGNPYLLARDEDGYYTRMVRTKAQEEYEITRIEGVQLYDMEAGEHCAMSKSGLYYVKGGAVHLFHFEQANDENIIDLAEAGIIEGDITYFGVDGEELEILDNYRESNHTEYSKLLQGEEKDRTVVTLGAMFLSTKMKRNIAIFNRNQNDITIEPIIYANDANSIAGFDKLTMDLIRGEGPDIIITEGIDVDVLANAGVFANLYSYMERDAQCNKNMLIESVLKAYETEGKLYVAAPNFYIFSMWGGKSIVCGQNGIDMERLARILQNNGGDINSIYGFSADESVMRTLCTMSMDEFIDWDAGVCNFSGTQFQNIMKFANEYQGKRFDSLFSAVRNKEILFVIQNISCVEDYCLWSGIFGEPIEFIGYPTASGSGTVAYFTEGLAINSQTKKPSECWAFVRNYILNGYEKGMGFPIVKTKLESVFEEAMQEEYVLDEKGNAVKVYKKMYQERKNKDASVGVIKASKKDVEVIKNLIESISGKHAYHNDIMNIIDEEADSYYSGQKSIEQVSEIIQNRVQLYLDENK